MNNRTGAATSNNHPVSPGNNRKFLCSKQKGIPATVPSRFRVMPSLGHARASFRFHPEPSSIFPSSKIQPTISSFGHLAKFEGEVGQCPVLSSPTQCLFLSCLVFACSHLAAEGCCLATCQPRRSRPRAPFQSPQMLVILLYSLLGTRFAL